MNPLVQTLIAVAALVLAYAALQHANADHFTAMKAQRDYQVSCALWGGCRR